ncbi:MAG: hypothetical protein QNK36_14570 [Colwellia sp.]|nr:hypothetical protein [Colwellia sp.]
MKTIKILCSLALAVTMVTATSNSFAKDRTTGRGTGPIIYVVNQDLYFDSIVVADPLPQKGRFQQLIPSQNGLTTEFGPGDVGHLGGRWWIDLNDDGEMDGDDKYFLCPLLGPGRETP